MAVRAANYWSAAVAVVALGLTARADDPPAPPPIPPEAGWPHTVLQPDLPPTPPGPPRGRGGPPVTDEPPLSPFLPPRPGEPGGPLPSGAAVTLPAGGRQLVRFSSRYDRPLSYTIDKTDDRTQRFVFNGGLIVNVVYLGGPGGAAPQEVEFAADTAVVWKTGGGALNPAAGADTGAGTGKMEFELYLAGDVVIRSLGDKNSKGVPVQQVLRAEEIYYDVSRSKAIALCADLEMKDTGTPDSIHVRGKEVWRLGKNEWRSFEALTFSSKRPADPNLILKARETTLLEQGGVRRNIFGIAYRDQRTGEIDTGSERTLVSKDSTLRLLGVPIFYAPRANTDLSEPFGPLVGLSFGNDQIYGFQLYTTWDMHKLLALRPPNGHRWILGVDYLGDRGVGVGTNYQYTNPNLFGLGGLATGQVRAYGINDRALEDQLGAGRGPQPEKPDTRGRIQWWNNQQLFEAGTTWVRHQHQIEYLSDKNFLEQYYKVEFDQAQNQETFYYVNGASGNAWAAGLAEVNLDRPWVTETNWLPRVDGALVGQSLLDDWFVYTARASAGNAQFIPTKQEPFAVLPTDQERMDLGRFDLNQRLSLPFDLGPVRVDPYGVMDLAYYSRTLTQQQVVGPAPPYIGGLYGTPGVDYQTGVGDGRGRFYGGGGLNLSTTMSRAYADVRSDLHNLNGLNHKVTFGANYFAAYSDTPYTQLPQLDRMFSDSLDQGYRNARPVQSTLIPGPGGVALQTSPLFDPQQYAIRRLVENSPDTLDSMQVLQLELLQRLQTKRGMPGNEHTIDWMTLNLSGSFFPDAARDNYGTSWAFLEYLYLWHVGDRMSVSANGWFDPIENGTRYWDVGLNFNRPGGTNLFVAYRHTDPLDSRALTVSLSYQLTSKYSMNLASSYDFGLNEALSNSLNLSRTGTDMTFLLGFTYNALLNNFGFQFSFVPNAAGATGRLGGGSQAKGR